MFDGISCGRVALDRIGITPEVYFASEIDKSAEKISADNWPDIIRLGDAYGVDGWDLGKIDLLLGGSPCTNWSITKRVNRETETSGIGWELFSLYVRALKKFKPRYFLYENVKSMSKGIREEITRALGVEPIVINSALVSGQKRERLYWTNIPGVTQPEDKGILFKDVLEHGTVWREKAYTLRASHGIHGGPSSVLREIRTPGKFSFNGVAEIAEAGAPSSYEVKGGEITIKGKIYPLSLPDGYYKFRKLSSVESCRLQTLPENYCKAVSDAQACKAIGNGWTVDVIAHILGNMKTKEEDCYTMKSLILSAQDARELEKLGGLTVSKQIKPTPRYIQGAEFTEAAPGWVLHIPGVRRLGAGDGVADVFAPPVNAGDAVYIREPWYRLRDPKTDEPSDRVILAADAVIGEGQTAYKWASPVSMPEEQARRFARVRRVSPVYGENVAAWEIELEKVAADVARAIDAGLPYSTAQGEEGASDYYTVAGDMTAEDRERMVEAIDRDRARLYQVQNRLVWIELRRRELANILADPAAADHYDLDLAKGQIQTIEQQKADLADEEADLRAALEDAGAPAPTVEEMARERLDSVRSEIEAAALDPNRAEALAQLEQLERDLSAYIDAAAEGAEEAREEPREDAPAAADTGDAQENGEAQEAQDAPTEGETGSYTIGK